MAALKKQEEKYCQGRFEGLTQRQAYRQAFPISKNWQDGTVDNKACALEKKSEIRVRLEEIKNENASVALLSRENILERLVKIIDASGIKYKGSDAVKALELYVRMCGYESPKEVTVSSDTTATLAVIASLLKGGDAE